MRQEKPVCKLLAEAVTVNIYDVAADARYTLGKMWFNPEQPKIGLTLTELAKNELMDDGKTEPQVYEVFVLNHFYRFSGLSFSKAQRDPETGLYWVEFSSHDLLAVDDYAPKIKSIRK